MLFSIHPAWSTVVTLTEFLKLKARLHTPLVVKHFYNQVGVFVLDVLMDTTIRFVATPGMSLINPQHQFRKLTPGDLVSIEVDPESFTEEVKLSAGYRTINGDYQKEKTPSVLLQKKHGVLLGLVVWKQHETEKDIYGARVVDTHAAVLLSTNQIIVVSGNDWFRNVFVKKVSS